MKALLVGVGDASKSIVEESLSARRHEQTVAPNGAEGLQAIRISSPALIVLEDPLPDMRGIEFCRRTRACAEGAGAIILVITRDDDELPAVLDAGATDLHVTSPGPSALAIRLRIAEQQAQKMEALGSLAAGIAHDFNNLLSVIVSYSTMLARDLEPGDPMRTDLEEIKKAGTLGANLTLQLLAFGRKEIPEPGAPESNAIVDPAAAVATTTAASETGVPGGDETVLLVEDDERVRALARTILRRCGYKVIEAHGGGDALLICEQNGAIIHLLLTDVVMPRMNGPQLAERLRRVRPDMRVLYMSGYTDDSIVHHRILDSNIAFIQKPITPDALARKVRAVLDSPRHAEDRRDEVDAGSGIFVVRDEDVAVKREATVLRVFVGGIGHDATEPDLHAAFARVGVQLAQVELVVNRATGRLRGFAFVAVADDPASGLAKANENDVLARMRQALVDDHPLTVQPVAREFVPLPGNDPTAADQATGGVAAVPNRSANGR
jgi:DNA-binding response OmpR family regulator